MKKNRKKKIYLVLFCSLILIMVAFISSSFANTVDDIQVAGNTDLTYYIDVLYDGKDALVVTSNSTTKAEVTSDYIYVEDKIPEGLTFKKFVSSSDGTIGATLQGNDTISCPGYVVDGAAGLVYDYDSGIASFKVKNLQAGCKITVGITTTTPVVQTGKRLDFYNTAYAREGNFSTSSNTVHAIMGKNNVDMYTVHYEYDGVVPSNAPSLPGDMSYAVGNSVGLLNDINIQGYVFSGWTSNDVEIANNTFNMPNKNVTLKGSFIEKSKQQVIYSIEGETPDDYSLPTASHYGVGDYVEVDNLQAGSIVNGYKFLGWTTEDTDVDDGSFEMPNKTVHFVGKFEQQKYKVIYKFQGNVLPPNAASLLPATKSYVPGSKVTLDNVSDVAGYKFLGWYSDNTFKMPNEDVIVVGEWKEELGTFDVNIVSNIVNYNSFYSKGNVVKFKTDITNTNNFPIKDVLVEEKSDDCSFISGSGYELLNDKYVKINSLLPNETISIYSKYVAGNDLVRNVSNVVSLSGAISTNNYVLKDDNYDSVTNFKVANINLDVLVNSKNDSDNKFELYSDSGLTNKISDGLDFTNLVPGQRYYLKQVANKSGYNKLDDSLEVIVSNSGDLKVTGYNVTYSEGKYILDVNNSKKNHPIIPGNDDNNKNQDNVDIPNTIDKIWKYVLISSLSLLIIIGYIIYHKYNKKLTKKKNELDEI